jgi:hypothetical protein
VNRNTALIHLGCDTMNKKATLFAAVLLTVGRQAKAKMGFAFNKRFAVSQ